MPQSRCAHAGERAHLSLFWSLLSKVERKPGQNDGRARKFAAVAASRNASIGCGWANCGHHIRILIDCCVAVAREQQSTEPRDSGPPPTVSLPTQPPSRTASRCCVLLHGSGCGGCCCCYGCGGTRAHSHTPLSLVTFRLSLVSFVSGPPSSFPLPLPPPPACRSPSPREELSSQ